MKKSVKRMLSLYLAVLMVSISFTGNAQFVSEYEVEAELESYNAQTFYSSLTPSNDKQGSIVEIDQAGNLWQYGYYNAEVGYQMFNNLFYDENLWQMTQSAPSANAANWEYGDYALPGRYIYPAAQYDSAVTFNAPMEGTVTIGNTSAWVGGGSTDGVRIAVYAGETKIWPTSSEWCDINSTNNNSVMVPEITVALHEGEQLHFLINCNGNTTGDMTCWYQTVTYISKDYQTEFAPGGAEEKPPLVYSVKDGYTVPSDASENEVVTINQNGSIWQFGCYSSDAGYQPFNTQYFGDGQWRMTMDSASGPNWDYGVYALDNNIYPAGNRDNAVTFNAPREGTVSITAQDGVAWVGGGTTDGIQVAIYANDMRIWPADSEWCVINQETNNNCASIPEIKVALHQGDQLHFRVNCRGSSQNDNTSWYPIVTYISEDYQDEFAPSDKEILPVYDVKESYHGFEVDQANTPISIDQTDNIWQFGYYNALDGYTLFNSLYYEEGDWRMTKDSNGGTNWDYGRYSLQFICPSSSSDGVTSFVAPVEGTYTIDAATVWAHQQSNGGANIAIYVNGIKIWPADSDWCYLLPGVETGIPEITVALHQGESLRFQTNCNGNAQNDNVIWYPVVRCASKIYDEAYAPKEERENVYPFRITATQGDNGWYYLYAEAGDDLLHFQPAFVSNWWWTAQNDFTTGIIRSDGLHPGDYDAILGFKAPYTGKIQISFAGNKVTSPESCDGNDGIKFAVYKSSDYGTMPLYPTGGSMALVENQTTLNIDPFTAEVSKNELILFRVNRNVNSWCDMLNCVPTIAYLEVDKEDSGFDDPFAPDTGEKAVCVPGADMSRIPIAPDISNAQSISVQAFAELLATHSASGVYSLQETLVFDNVYDNQTVDLRGVSLVSAASPAVQISADGFQLKNLSVVSNGGEAVRFTGARDAQLQASYVSGQVGADGDCDCIRLADCRIDGSLVIQPMSGLTVENNILGGTVTVAASDAEISHNTIANTVNASGKENVLLYANVLNDQVLLLDINNSVLLKNNFNADGATVTVDTTNHISIAENAFAARSGPAISLNKAGIALVTGNTTAGAAICAASGCGHVYGNDIPGALDGESHVGADTSKLPADRTEVFTGMTPKTTILYQGSKVSVNTYIRQAARKQQDVVLQPGVYVVDPITFTETKDVNLYGYGVLLIFQDYTKKALAMNGCEKIAVKGLTMDHVQVANAQGTVRSVEGDTVVWMPDAGYDFDLLDESRFNRNAAATAFRAGSRLPYADVTFSANRVRNADGSYTLTGANTLNAGDRIMFRGVFCDVNNLYDCNYITYEDVTVWNGSGFAIRELEGEGNTILNRFAVTPGAKPNGAVEERMISTCDATHSTNVRHGIQVTNSLFEYMNDDGANVNGTYGNVTGFDAGTKRLAFQPTTPYNTTVAEIRQGDKLRIMTNDGRLLLDTTAAEAGSGGSVILSEGFVMPSNATVIVQNLSASGSGFRYENCVIRNNRSRGLLLQGLDGNVSNCTLENNGMAGILISATLKDDFSECGFVENLEINQNLIRGNGYYGAQKKYSAITVMSDSASVDDPCCQNHRNITIQNNAIEDRYSQYAIYVSGARQAEILDNVWGARNVSLNPAYPNDTAPSAFIDGATDIEVSGNMYPAGTEIKVILSSKVANIHGTDLGKLSSEIVSSVLSTRNENGKWYVDLTLRNLSQDLQSCSWMTVSPEDMFGSQLSGRVMLNPGETKICSIPVARTALQLFDPDDTAEVTVAYCVMGYDYSYNTASVSFAAAQKTDAAIEIDGYDIEDAWNGAEALLMNRKNQTAVLPGWQGPDDLSAEIKLLWDNTNLYFYAVVIDDVHDQPEKDGNIWLGDGFQAAFSPDSSTSYAELGWALGNDGNVYSYCWNNTIPGTIQTDNGFITGGRCTVRRDEDAKKTFYEASIPWTFIGSGGQAPADGSSIRFTLLLNDSDSNGREGYMNIFDGIGQGKHPEKFGELYMSGLMNASEPEKPPINPPVTPDEPPADPGDPPVVPGQLPDTVPDGSPAVPSKPSNSPDGPTDSNNEPTPPMTTLFQDVDANDWYSDDVRYVIERGLMNGVSATSFAPEAALTRGMIVTILWRMEAEPKVLFDGVYTDVADAQWYADAVKWVATNGIVNGYGNGAFGPNDPATREQLAVILYRYAKYKGRDVSAGERRCLLGYADAHTVSEYAIPAMQWACSEGLINGAGGKLMPTDNTTRAQIAAIIRRYLES